MTGQTAPLEGSRLVRRPLRVTWEATPWCCKEFEAQLGDVACDGQGVDYAY
jgi:hypothetical protein